MLVGFIGPDALVVYQSVRQLHGLYQVSYHFLDHHPYLQSALALLVVNV